MSFFSRLYLKFLLSITNENLLTFTHIYSIPTRQFLAQFRFRPWRGVFCSDAYLNDIEYAMKFTQNLLHTYADLSIEPLVESALRSDSDISLLRRLVGVQTEIMENSPETVENSTETVENSTDINSSEINTCILLYTPYDLRVHDHPVLNASCRNFDEVIPLFLYSEPKAEAEYSGFEVRPYVSEIWIHESLKDLEMSLKKMNGGLVVRKKDQGSVAQTLKELIRDVVSLDKRRKVRAIYTGTRFEPHARSQDKIWADALRRESKIGVQFFNTSLLYDPKEVELVEKSCKQKSGGRFAHFGTLMWFIRLTHHLPSLSRPESPPKTLNIRGPLPRSSTWSFESKKWHSKILSRYTITEAAGRTALRNFVSRGLPKYEKNRSRLDVPDATSRLSPYLRHGNVSPRELHFAIIDSGSISKTFSRRLYWRDLAYFQHHFFPKMFQVGIRNHYDETEWTNNAELLKLWKFGRTGFPLVRSARSISQLIKKSSQKSSKQNHRSMPQCVSCTQQVLCSRM